MCDTSQAPMSALKASASANIQRMSDTVDTSQPPMSALKAAAS